MNKCKAIYDFLKCVKSLNSVNMIITLAKTYSVKSLRILI